MNTKKLISAGISLAIAFSAFAALAEDTVPSPTPTRSVRVSPSKTPIRTGNETAEMNKRKNEAKKVEQEAKKSAEKTARTSRETAVKACNATFKDARNAFENANQKARQDFLKATKTARDAWKESDKGDAVKQAYRTAQKTAQDAFTAAKLNNRTAWDKAVSAHNLCVRQNTAHPTPIPTATATSTPAPSQ